ncbi:hypothetical protein MSC49_41430 (plasmid) [Methylosinus sp. C49]|uniref:hypothetical protein n=1 Tax=Methylosinus sp. C49 TaxID=2699395 RepID=UPI0013671FA7|nr:hypothetical protein [Methylosinus sp. C49]BBU64208.1 hypothetical protein MSC49_41430 [Methylosinus sp. C49]
MKSATLFPREKSLREIFAIPLTLAALTVFALLAALLGDGDLWRCLAWAALFAPIAVILRHAAFGGARRERAARKRPRERA